MDKSWRPKNWKQIKGIILDSPQRPHLETIDWVIERVADAILEAYLESNEGGIK